MAGLKAGEEARFVDQREVQRLGGRAAKHPASYIVYSLLSKHRLFNVVLDVTYGRGGFYSYRKPPFLVGADPWRWDWEVEPDIFIPRPVWALKAILAGLGLSFDVVVCDPPAWERGVAYNRRDIYGSVLGSAELIISKAVELAGQLGIKYFLLHYNKPINLKVVEDVEFRYVARYLNNPDMRTTRFTLYEVGCHG